MAVAGSRHRSWIKHVHGKKGAFLRHTEGPAVAVQPRSSQPHANSIINVFIPSLAAKCLIGLKFFQASL